MSLMHNFVSKTTDISNGEQSVIVVGSFYEQTLELVWTEDVNVSSAGLFSFNNYNTC